MSKYFEKPPLHYWVNALSMSILGKNETAARLPSALFGLCGVLFIYHMGRKLFGRRDGLLCGHGPWLIGGLPVPVADEHHRQSPDLLYDGGPGLLPAGLTAGRGEKGALLLSLLPLRGPCCAGQGADRNRAAGRGYFLLYAAGKAVGPVAGDASSRGYLPLFWRSARRGSCWSL